MMLYNRTRYLVDHLIHVCLFVLKVETTDTLGKHSQRQMNLKSRKLEWMMRYL